MRLGLTGALAAVLCLAGGARAAPVYGYEVVRSFPHDPSAFTEGLFYRDGYLYEGTGLQGRSSIRKVRLDTGEVVQSRALDRRYFGEGIVAWGGRLYELTWRSQKGFIYDLGAFKRLGSFRYNGEGWGLTHDGRRLIMSDGTPELRFLDPITLRETGRVQVTDEGVPVDNLNELEFVDGEVYANVWLTDRIARIDPATGKVVGWIDLAGIVPPGQTSEDAVLNGIAYDKAHGRLFVTGKLWPKVFEIRLARRPPPAN